MKRYISRATYWLLGCTLISAAIMAAGIIFIAIDSPNIGLQISLTGLGTFSSILFLTCFFAEKSRTLTIDAEKVILPRGADQNGKMVFQKTVVRIDQIRSLNSELRKGDKVFSNDCYFHTFILEDGAEITFTLYAYGKEAEIEILETIQKRIG